MTNDVFSRLPGLALGAVLARTLAHFWPDVRGWLREGQDTHQREKIVYDRVFLLGMGLLISLLKLGSQARCASNSTAPSRGQPQSPERLPAGGRGSL